MYIELIVENLNNEKIDIDMRVSNLIKKWYTESDIPTNDDKILYCNLSCCEYSTRLYPETFGELMEMLTGDKVNKN